MEQKDQKSDFLSSLERFNLKLDLKYSTEKPTNQTFEKYVEVPRKVAQKKRQIVIVPLAFEDLKFMQILKTFSSAFFMGMEIEICQSESIDSWKLSQRMNDGVKQYHAGEILEKLKKLKPPSCHCLIAVTLFDLYPRDSWNYVFGLASLNDGVGVFSCARFTNTFWDPNSLPDPEWIIYRSAKTMCHELCHQFGIKHCIKYYCLMNKSEDDVQSETKPFQLCTECEKKLQHSIGYDMHLRYQHLHQACKQIGGKHFLKEALIYQRVLEYHAQKTSKPSQKLPTKPQTKKPVFL